MSDDSLLLAVAAADFAARRHIAQKRKGARQEPYFNHLAEVAALLAEATDGSDAALVAAGYLHDTLEDTPTEYEELVSHFGGDVADLVAAVTDDKSLPKAERKRLQIVHAAAAKPRPRLLKIADKISNLRSIALAGPGTRWGAECNYLAALKLTPEEVRESVKDLERDLYNELDSLHHIVFRYLSKHRDQIDTPSDFWTELTIQ